MEPPTSYNPNYPDPEDDRFRSGPIEFDPEPVAPRKFHIPTRLERIAVKLMSANIIAGNAKTYTEASQQAIDAAKKLIELIDRETDG